MQEEVTQKTIALSMKTGKLTAQALQATLKKYLQHRAKGPKLHHGRQSLKQLKAHGAALTNIEVTERTSGIQTLRQEVRRGLHLTQGQDHPAAPLHRDFQGQGCGQSGTGVPGVHGQNAHQGAAASIRKVLAAAKQKAAQQPKRAKEKIKQRGLER